MNKGTLRTLLGTGRLNWPRGERISDRYGRIMLTSEPIAPHKGELLPGDDPDGETRQIKIDVGQLAGKKGRLIAIIVTTRESYHIGDLFRGIGPQTPQVGETIEIGSGTLFVENGVECGEEYFTIGLSPDDGRESDWLNPEALYKCHNQTVELYFEEDK